MTRVEKAVLIEQARLLAATSFKEFVTMSVEIESDADSEDALKMLQMATNGALIMQAFIADLD